MAPAEMRAIIYLVYSVPSTARGVHSGLGPSNDYIGFTPA